ncbi:MAG: GTP pyrophosphokinase family protein [Bacillota bacterium]|nr:GTP pyrophosphokinase family protein [Bacillota bacterium]
MKDIREWDTFLIPYEQAVEELKVKFKHLRRGYDDLGEYSPIEFVVGRVKKVSSILSKTRRLGIEYEEIAEKMEDIAGIRIMCQLLGDIYHVVELLRERDGKDFTILYEKDYIRDKKESGYRSYHLVISYPVYSAVGYREILAEIQIRTLAMNFWAIIEHSLNYKYQDQVPLSVRKRLQSAAASVWALDLEMQQLKEEIKSAQKLFKQNAMAVHNINAQLQLLSAVGDHDLAAHFQSRLDAILDLSSTERLEELYEQINSCLSGEPR